MLPHDHVLRARARQIAEIFNSGTQPLQNLSVIKSVKTAEIALSHERSVGSKRPRETKEVDGRGFGKHAIENGTTRAVGSSGVRSEE